MKINLKKIEKFYSTSLGEFVLQNICHALESMIDKAGLKNQTCVLSASAFSYIKKFSNMKRLSLQAYHEQETYIWRYGMVICEHFKSNMFMYVHI